MLPQRSGMSSQQSNVEATAQTEAVPNRPSISNKGFTMSQTDEEEAVRSHNHGSPSQSSPRLRPSTSHQSTGSTPSRPRWRRCLSKTKFFIVDQWFLFALGFFILLASQVQVPDSQQDKKEKVVTYLCVAVIFFITGCTLPTKVLLANYSGWKLHIFVQIQSFLLTSAIVYAVVSLCATNPDFMDAGLLVGVIFTGSVPTTISSNVIMTKQANGNQALTVVQSTLGNFLGPFISPLLILMYTSTGAWYTKVLPGLGSGGFGQLYRRVFMQLGLSIFLPLVRSQILGPDCQETLHSRKGADP
jgi:sodium/bile acid cotransporter 7